MPYRLNHVRAHIPLPSYPFADADSIAILSPTRQNGNRGTIGETTGKYLTR